MDLSLDSCTDALAKTSINHQEREVVASSSTSTSTSVASSSSSASSPDADKKTHSTKHKVVVTPELIDRIDYFAIFFQPYEIAYVPNFPYINEVLTLTANKMVEFASTLSADCIKILIVTANYFNHSATPLLIAELMWVLGQSLPLWKTMFQNAGEIPFIIRRMSREKFRGYQCHGHRFWEYVYRTTSLYEVRPDINNRYPALYQALKGRFPKPFAGIAHGLRSGVSIDANKAAYFGNLRLAKWYVEKFKCGLGSCFSQNTSSRACLEYALSIGTDITRYSIHTANESCKEFLKQNGGVDSRKSDSDYGSEVSFNAAIIRSDMRALEEIVAEHGDQCFSIEQVLISCTKISTFNFVASHCRCGSDRMFRWPEHPGTFTGLRKMLAHSDCKIPEHVRIFFK